MAQDSSAYIDDLLRRLDSREELPQTGPVKSSVDTVSWHAAREAEQLDDPAHVPAIRRCIRTARKVRTFQKLAIVLGGLIRNTRDPEALSAYTYLMQSAPRSDITWMYILAQARKSRIEEAKPYAYGILDEPPRGRLALAAAIKYLGTMGGVGAIPTIGALLDADCHGRFHPMYCVSALAEIGHADGLPYLRRAIDRHAKSRKKEPAEVRYYARHAVERIETAPPYMLDGMEVRWWMVPPDVPERIAVCSREEEFAVLCCDASWQVCDRRAASSSDEAQRIVKELAGTEQLSGHSRVFHP